jgi:hypothetical protein
MTGGELGVVWVVVKLKIEDYNSRDSGDAAFFTVIDFPLFFCLISVEMLQGWCLNCVCRTSLFDTTLFLS